MPRYIDADALLKDLVENRGFLPALVKHAILNAPTIEAVPVVRGEWLDGVDYYEPPMVNPYFMVTHLICSECGNAHINPEKKPNFCPNCGADMRGESEVKE